MATGDLVERLRSLDPVTQADHVEVHAAATPTAELVAVLTDLGRDLGRVTQVYVTDVIADRGDVDAVAGPMLAAPTGEGARRLAQVLGRMCEAHPSLRPQILRSLALGVDGALDAGAGTWGAGELLGWMAECAGASAGEPVREAVAAARRYLAVAAGEARPYTPGLDYAGSVLAAAH
jgi:hypothetical protein